MQQLRKLRDGLLQQEILLLQEAGYSVIGHESSDGKLWELTVVAPEEKTGIQPLTLSITLPDSYPLLPPRVIARDLAMGHHQHPFSNELCLIERSTQNWIPEWHLAGLLDNQLKRAIAAGRAAHGQGTDGFEQGEPYSAYYDYTEPAGFLIDSSRIAVPIGCSGELEGSFIDPGGPGTRLLIILDQLWRGAEPVYEAPATLHRAFGPYQPLRLRGRWVSLGEPPRTSDPQEIWRIAASADPQQPRLVSLHNTAPFEIRLVGFPEEHGPETVGTGWILILKKAGGISSKKSGKRGRPMPVKTADSYNLVRAYRAGHSDLAFRSPETKGLEKKQVAVLGCGAIGSVLVEQLARAGVGTFHLVDQDTLEPGNLSRHAGGLDTICMDKSSAMAQRISQINPYANAIPRKFHIGLPALLDGRSETDVLAEIINTVDMVIDATAEVGVQQYTSLLARDLATSWVALDATPGIGGGSVIKIDAESEICFGCFQWHQHTGSIPEAPAVEGELVQPVGCASPTFTGTGFDLSVIALQAARVVVGALTHPETGGYPEDGHDAHILTLRRPDGTPVPPQWQGFPVSRHPKCGNHEKW
jgi:ubiquitin-protein ligase